MQPLFVYNAKSGKVRAALDIVYKIISSSIYSCDLCSLTPDIFNEKGFYEEGEALEPFMDKYEIAGIEDVEGLIKLIEKRLKG